MIMLYVSSPYPPALRVPISFREMHDFFSKILETT